MTTGTGSAGVLPNGQTYGQSLSKTNGDGIIIGGGNLYVMAIGSATAIPPDAEIEVDTYNVGVCSGGFKTNYKPQATEVYNQFDQLVKTFITREEISCKTGLMTWNLQNMANLSTATYMKDGNTTRVVFTGSGSLAVVLVRFVHTEPDGTVIRFTMVGQGGKGFGLEFGDKPVSVDAEFQGIAYFNNFLAEFRETSPASNAVEG
ncbi:MAG: hypothetical protein ACRCX8_19565 [Sarcina sp.]